MSARLVGKSARVTGATSGIGQATAITQSWEGARVLVAVRDENADSPLSNPFETLVQVVQTIAFLASEDASHIYGAVRNVDGVASAT